MAFRYLDGVHRAEKEGRVVRSTTIHEDRHSPVPPLGSMGHFNTRGLDSVGTVLATMAGKQAGAHALVLGGGTGIACDDMKNVAPALHIEAVTLADGFNPYVRILIRGHDIYEQVEALVGQELIMRRREGTIYDIAHRRDQGVSLAMSDDESRRQVIAMGSDPRTDRDSHIPTTLIEELHNEGRLQMFQELDSPTCDRLHIAHFPNEFASSEPFDLIYDDKGPLYYVDPEQRGTVNDATKHALELLSPRGVLYAACHDPIFSRAMDIRTVVDDTVSNAVFVQGSPELLVVQEEHGLHSPLQQHIRTQGLRTERGVVHLMGGASVKDLIRKVISAS